MRVVLHISIDLPLFTCFINPSCILEPFKYVCISKWLCQEIGKHILCNLLICFDNGFSNKFTASPCDATKGFP